jgi:hypothetical protein
MAMPPKKSKSEPTHNGPTCQSSRLGLKQNKRNQDLSKKPASSRLFYFFGG